MVAVQKFQDIIAWQKAHQLALKIYLIAGKFPRFEEFGLANQMRRCTVSVPSNIAEGFKRRSLKDSSHFYNMAEGSLEELKYQLLLSRDLGNIADATHCNLLFLAEETGRLLFAWKKVQR